MIPSNEITHSFIDTFTISRQACQAPRLVQYEFGWVYCGAMNEGPKISCLFTASPPSLGTSSSFSPSNLVLHPGKCLSWPKSGRITVILGAQTTKCLVFDGPLNCQETNSSDPSARRKANAFHITFQVASPPPFAVVFLPPYTGSLKYLE